MLLAQEVTAGINKNLLRHKAHNLSSCHAYSAGVCRTAHLVKGNVQRGDREVGHVHRYLRNAIFVNEPAYGLACLQRAGLHYRLTVLVLYYLAHYWVALAHGASFLAYVECNGVGAACGCRVKVIVYCNKEVTCSHSGRSCACNAFVKGTCAKVGLLLDACHPFGQGLILSLAAHGKVAAFGLEGCSLVAVCGHVQFVGNTLGKASRKLGALFHCDTRNRNERAHVTGTHTRVSTLVLAHVY